MEAEQRPANKASLGRQLRRVPRAISRVVENFFYKLGYEIARRPLRWIVACTLVAAGCASGLLRFRQEKNPLRLWIPPDSDFVRDTEWLMGNFGEGQRVETVTMTGDDVLEPKALLELNEITKRLLSVETSSRPALSWTDVCFKVPVISGVVVPRRKRGSAGGEDDFFEEAPGSRVNASVPYEPVVEAPSDVYCSIVESLPRGCLFRSILDLWDYDSELIADRTKDEILERVNAARTSPSLGHPIVFTDLLGGVETDERGRVVSARAVNTLFTLRVNFTKLRMNETGNEAGTADWVTADVFDWEGALLSELEASSRHLASRSRDRSLAIWYEAGRSWGDVSAAAMFQDFGKLILGIAVMCVYVQLVLSRFNWIEWRFCLAGLGLVCVAGAFVIAVGLCSLCGVPYGPVHTSLPFMLMGLGVDDIFVIMASWDRTMAVEANRARPLAERIALALSHAGAAITVTSLTDVVAFAIGASTILPSLQSFCVYAAVGVAVTYLLQVTLFVAFFTLDVKRAEARRNGAIPCIVHATRPGRPLETSREPKVSVASRFFDLVYPRIVLGSPGKLTVLLVSLGLASFGVVGYVRLEQWFDPEWFIPGDTYLGEYFRVKSQYYPKRGYDGSVFIGEVAYSEELPRIVSLVESLENMSSAIDRVDAWPRHFVRFVRTHYRKDAATGRMPTRDFHDYLSKFLFSRTGGKYQSKFRFAANLTCGEIAPRILLSVIDFEFVAFTGPDRWIPGMDGVKALAGNSGINGPVVVWSRAFASWVTDKVIADELNRNLILALACVMATTAVLVAEPQTCLWILVCVLLTLVDVCGFMHYWGLTIDIVSCIGLELAVGLSVDYAAHVAHAFLNESGSVAEGEDRATRVVSALRHIGAAVAYGAGSTLLAQSTMAFSEAYVFRSFFKIFFLVVVFGLWHGLVLLPVVLGTIGPRSLHSPRRRPAALLPPPPRTDRPKDATELEQPLAQQ